MSLRPTKPRLEVLRAVADGLVMESNWFPYESWMKHPGGIGKSRTVTDRCRSMRIAGWIELEARDARRTHRVWKLTAAGRAVLEANGGTP